MSRSKWPVALATLFVVLLGWYLLYTQRIVQALRADAETLTEIFSVVQRGLTAPPGGQSGLPGSPSPAVPGPGLSEIEALFELQRIVLETGVPLVLTSPRVGRLGEDSVIAVENLPFRADIATPEGQERVLAYVRRLDARRPQIGDLAGQHIHFGDTPEIRRLRWIPWLQAAGLLLTVAFGFTLLRVQRRAESEKAWTAMARELAHQLGTPLSSLQGWLEVLRLPHAQRPAALGEGEIAGAIEEDLVRLERISHRFELIGRDPELGPIDLRDVVRDLERYLRARLPRLASNVVLEVDVPETLPAVRGNETLLVWALENVVKNALDAMAGRGGAIRLEATEDRAREEVVLRVHDQGPGVDPGVRDKIFEAGVSTKAGGWGVGLALSRRIVEGVHEGRIELLDGREGGATFQIRIPAAVPNPAPT